MEEALAGAKNPDNQSSITFGSAKRSSSLGTYKKVVLCMYSGHIHVYCHARIIGDFLLNNGVNLKNKVLE